MAILLRGRVEDIVIPSVASGALARRRQVEGPCALQRAKAGDRVRINPRSLDNLSFRFAEEKIPRDDKVAFSV